MSENAPKHPIVVNAADLEPEGGGTTPWSGT